MADVKHISPDEFMKARMLSDRGSGKYKDVYQAIEDMQKNQCIKIDLEEKREAVRLYNSILVRAKRAGDNRFEFFRRESAVYVCKIK